METEVGVEGNDEGKFEENGIAKSSSTFSSSKQFADPVVYKLVRLEGDGRLVPATDDEVMEVKGLLADVNSEVQIVADTGQAIGFISNEESFCGMPHLASKEDLLQTKNAEANPDKLSAELEETDSTLAPSFSESHLKQCRGDRECSNPPNKLVQVESSTSEVGPASKPDFSKLNGEICLDNLSIRELHETFKATFGRETTVKDKQWLKRRITMGLTNSCDVSTSTFVIKDNKLVKKDEGGSYNSVDGSFTKDPATAAINSNKDTFPACHSSELDDHQVISEKRLRNQSTDENCGIYDHQSDRAAKRVRKPTRRYIEELSESEAKESGGRSTNLVKQSGLGPISPNPHMTPVRNISLDGRTVITRLESLGGSGIQVPCVSRIRRSRPRKNFMALMKFNPSGKIMATSLVKKATLGARSFQPDDRSKDSFMKVRSAPEEVYQFVTMPEKDEQLPTVGAVGLGKNMDQKCKDSSRGSDDNIPTVPTSKGGIRRKHHRAWTISEVMKLIEGVSRYGAGRWSEIKRLAFSSYSYRTSVDLKDKWRNLLKASYAQTPPDKGVNPRKNTGSIPIPEPILSRVRELAEMQAQVPPNISSSKVVGIPRSNVHDKQSGYL